MSKTIIPKCIKCGVKLEIPKNWCISQMKYGNYVCRDCHTKNSKDYYHKDIDISREYRRRLHEKIRIEMFNLLGNKCKDCGITDIRVLEVHHVKNNGFRERKEIGLGTYLQRHILKEIKRGSDDYCLLCANCHKLRRLLK
jgi:hypothetical protein